MNYLREQIFGVGRRCAYFGNIFLLDEISLADDLVLERSGCAN